MDRNTKRKVDAATEINAQELALKAKQRVATDTGHLGQSIHVENEFTGHISRQVVAGVPSFPEYAAYVEFGTGVFVDVPKGWEEVAMSYYVSGKGFMYPQPYLHPSFEKQRKRYIMDLNKILSEESR